MDTPMQELIKRITLKDNEDGVVYLYPTVLKEELIQFLEKEKEFVLKARLDGFKQSGEGNNYEYPYNFRDDEAISEGIKNKQYYWDYEESIEK